MVGLDEVRRDDCAYFYDRVALEAHLKQLYGTQFDTRTNAPLPLADPAHVDERRAAVGLPSLADYAQDGATYTQVAAAPRGAQPRNAASSIPNRRHQRRIWIGALSMARPAAATLPPTSRRTSIRRSRSARSSGRRVVAAGGT